MHDTTFTFEAALGQQILCRRWYGDATPRAVVQIAHGASEHSDRYSRLAEVLVDAGYEVYANDHRGHGRTGAEFGRFGVARPGGWAGLVSDQHSLTGVIRGERPGTPIVLFGHSMGSMIAQGYIQQWADDLAGVVLSGTTGASVVDDATLEMIVDFGAGEAADEPSELFAAMFAGFNAPFDGPGATGFEWLSRDEVEVGKYVEDPDCGDPLSNGFVADMLSGSAEMWQPENEARISSDLAVYLFSGEHDPVGGEKAESVVALAARYEEMGIGPVTLRIYPDGRHEMLNETNRAEVHQDLLNWLATLDSPPER